MFRLKVRVFPQPTGGMLSLSALLLTADLEVLNVSPARSGFKASLFICIAADNVTLFVLHAGSDLEARLCCRITNCFWIDMYLSSASQTALPPARHTFSEATKFNRDIFD